MSDDIFKDDDFLFDSIEGKSTLAEKLNNSLSICENCGCKFEQGYKKGENGELILNKFKLCPKCRKELSTDDYLTTKDVKIEYNPYDWQKKFHASKARFKVVSGGARVGKDRSAAMEFIEKFTSMLNEDRDYTLVPKVHAWIIAPTYGIGKTLIRELTKYFPRQLVISYDKDNSVIETINNGLIELKSADDPDNLVSVGLDIVWITEAARIKQFDIVMGNIEDRLDSPGRGPYGSGGLALINSSPRGRTYFNRVCAFGTKGSSLWRPGWETFYVSRWEAPKYQKQRYKYFNSLTNRWDRDEPEVPGQRNYEQNLKLSRSDRQYSEDILGIPSDEDGAQFPNFRKNCVTERAEIPEFEKFKKKLNTPDPNHIYRIGYDPAKKIDGAWACVYDETDGKVVEYEKYVNMNYKLQIEVHIKALSIKWNNASVWYGETGVGEALEPYFFASGIPCIPKPEQGKNKSTMVENLSTLIKTDRFKIYNVNDVTEEAILQFEDYGYFITQNGNVTYHNITQGLHDDAVSCSYFAVADVDAISKDENYNYYIPNNVRFCNQDSINSKKNSKNKSRNTLF